ncbi:MAG: hydroxyacid dehydrogenase [Candidatus Omnitrophica bacterium]|nr:hydroxyacid dehydrogenase [Candidatus Omnitrophota bacterium]
MKPLITFLNIEDSWEIEYLKNRLNGHHYIKHFKEPAEHVIEQIKETEILSIFVNSNVNKKVIDSLPNLKLITTRSTGFDHIDLDAARQRNISVSNVPTYGENTVAEHTFALILALARNLKKAQNKTSKGDFSIKDLIGFDLKGKTIGVIGTGHIGLRVIKIAVGFSMNVLAFARRPNQFLAEVMGFKFADLDTILKESDIITLHIPQTKETRHLINKDNINLVKKGTIFINTSRGGLIDTDVLIKALDEGIFSGAGLDVLENEDVILKDKQLLLSKKKELYSPEKLKLMLKSGFLLQRDNVIFTPHSAFYSKEALQRILDTTIQNIESFSEGRTINSVC